MLKISGLSVSYGGLHALADVSLEVGEGEFVTIVGPNGAGKTTLLKAIGGGVPAGEQQMRALGGGLMARPDLLLLDEPSQGLGPRIVEIIFEAIAASRRARG